MKLTDIGKEADRRLLAMGISQSFIDFTHMIGKAPFYEPKTPVFQFPPCCSEPCIRETHKNRFVFCGIHTPDSPVGDLIALLFVDNDPFAWKYEFADLENGLFRVMAYVINNDNPMYSEYGSILVKNENGILKRVFDQ